MFRREELEQEGAPESKLYYLAKADVFCDLRLEELKEIADAAMMTTCQTGRIDPSILRSAAAKLT